MNEKTCGYVSLIGFPNAGKSTLLNSLIKKKVSIISPKVQTTQEEIMGILNLNNTQIIFCDTPGLNKKKKFNSKKMSRSVFNNLDKIICNLLIVDVQAKFLSDDINFLNKILKNYQKNILVINKIDLVNNAKLLLCSKKLNNEFKFDDTFMISAKKKKGTDDLTNKLKKLMPINNWVFNEKEYTNKNDSFIISEITREKIFGLLNKELPYVIKISTVLKKREQIINVYQKILIDKDSQKAIFIGKGGEKIKKIGTRARKDMENFFNKKVFLDISVVVKKIKNSR